MAGNAKYFTPAIASDYAKKFDTAAITPKFEKIANNFIAKMLANIDVYLRISGATGVPWYFVAAIHMRESGMDFTRHLHNGDPLTARTKKVPPGRPLAAPANGVSYTFAESAIDALKLKGFHTWKDWSIPAMLHLLEVYNGTGYIANRVTNPYLWSGTQWYTGGKYTRDHFYDKNAIDAQLGTAALLKLFLSNYSPDGKKKTLAGLRSAFAGFADSVQFFFTGQ